MHEHFFQCPYCWSAISMLLDPSASTSYVEDCEVCCNPIQLTTNFSNLELEGFTAESIEQ